MRWQPQHRPVLVNVVGAYDRGITTIDRATCAAELHLTADQVDESLILLVHAGFLEAEDLGSGEVLVTRVCPLSRQILGPGSSLDGGQATGQGELSGGNVLRATSWH